MKKILLITICLFIAGIAFSQDIEVKKFEPLEKDQTATLSPRKDINGVTCGLVKVLLKEPGAEFEGSVMGDVQFTGKEYLVYLPNGTKRLGIKHPDYLPTTIVFADYGTKKIASSTTYELKVKTNKKQAKVDNSKKGMAVFQVTPSKAILTVDGESLNLESSGQYTLNIPYGTHYYSVKYGTFSIDNIGVTIDKRPKAINVDLTEYYAELQVVSRVKDADIFINDEYSGKGDYEGMVVPGKYVIQLKKNGYHTLSQIITLGDNERLKVSFGEMKTTTGSIRVDYEPKGAEVFVDGKNVGVTPLSLDNLSTGNHYIEIKKDYCKKYSGQITVNEGQQLHVRGKLPMTLWAVLLDEAAKGDQCAMHLLGELYGNCFNLSGIWGPPCDDCYLRFLDKVKDTESVKWGLPEGGVPDCNVKEAIKYFENALKCKSVCKQNYNWSIKERLIVSYAYSKQFDKSFELAKDYYHKFVVDKEKSGDNQNDFQYVLAQIYLAWHYYYGYGTEKDVRMARRICTRIDEYSKSDRFESYPCY